MELKPAELKTADVGGIRMRWLEQGDGFPVVLIHGIPTGPRLWRGVMPRLENAQALAWEMVGYAGSIPEGRQRDISVRRQVDYLVSWLRHLGLERVVLVSHDLGGGVAQIAAVHHPNLVAGLLLTNSIAYDSWPVPAVKAMRAAGGVVEHLPDAVLKPSLRAFLRLGHDNGEIASASFKIHFQPYAEHNSAAAFIRQARSLDVRDTIAIQDELPRLGLPARVVWGAEDPFQGVHYGERLASDLGTRLERIEGGKHFTPEDHPDFIARAVNDLLREVTASA